MIVWSEKEGDRWHQPALQVAASGESSNFKWVKPHQQSQQSPNYQGSHNPEQENFTHKSLRICSSVGLRAITHEDSILLVIKIQ